MVRGRRARSTKTGAVVLGNGVQVPSLVDDPYCASPKRKDCKIDTSLDKLANNPNVAATNSGGKRQKSISPPPLSQSQTSILNGREKRTAAAAAAVYVRECLLNSNGHSKTRTQSIKHFLKTNSKSDSCDIPTTINNTIEETANGHYQDVNSINHHDNQVDNHKLIAELAFDLSEDDTCTEIFGKYEPSGHHLRSSPFKSNTQNIFLQEPVLSLNVDKSPNQASSIKIKKSLEIEPVFSSPPLAAASIVVNGAYSSGLNGQFNKIVSLSTSPKRENSLESTTSTFTSSNSVKSPSNCYLLNIDNSSCDSGVAFIDNKIESSPSRRRKPATPHRIVCPSPIKACCVTTSRTTGGGMSPSKKNIIGTTTSLLPPYQNNAQRRHPKSRRRLNQQEHENKYSLPSEEPQLGDCGVPSTADTIVSQPPVEYNCVTSCHTNKSILNSAKNPTAEQNTNNNYKITNAVTLNNTNSKIRLQAGNHHNTGGNRELSEFFPVRRSVRKTKTAVKEEMMRGLEKAILEERADGLKVIEFFEGKGRGIIADRPFQRGEFVVEYIGDLIDMSEANQREKKYALDENAGCYMYYFKHKNQQYCIDATAESGKLGRLVNHSRNGNLITKVVVVKNRPHLVLIAKDDIEPGEELTYDYGDRSKESLLHHPWLAF